MAEDRETEEENALVIPIESLRPEVLDGIIRDFVLQEGTDYGPVEYSLESKVAAVMKQLKSNQAVIVFDKTTESCSMEHQACTENFLVHRATI